MYLLSVTPHYIMNASSNWTMFNIGMVGLFCCLMVMTLSLIKPLAEHKIFAGFWWLFLVLFMVSLGFMNRANVNSEKYFKPRYTYYSSKPIAYNYGWSSHWKYTHYGKNLPKTVVDKEYQSEYNVSHNKYLLKRHQKKIKKYQNNIKSYSYAYLKSDIGHEKHNIRVNNHKIRSYRKYFHKLNKHEVREPLIHIFYKGSWFH